MRLNPSLQVLVALLLGLGAGMLVPHPTLLELITPVGTLWTNAIRMPIIPLIVAMIITGVARGSALRAAGGITARAIAVFLLLVALFTALVVPIAPVLLSGITLDPTATAALKASVTLDATAVPALSMADWVTSLIPTNPFKAAADGALLPLVLFAMCYGLALLRIGDPIRGQQVRFLDGVIEILLLLIRWVLLLAPLGIFALAFGLGARLGAPAAAAVAQYVAITALVTAVSGVLLWAFTIVVGRVSWRSFTAALLPALMIGVSSRSSLAALPALIEGVRRHLRLPEPVTNVVLPLGASIFKFNAATTWILGALFIAKLYGVELSSAQMMTFAMGTVLLSLTTPGIPSGGFFVQAPLYALVGLPAEGLGLLIAVDLLPDVFKTAVNVTGYASAAVLVGRAPGDVTDRDIDRDIDTVVSMER